MQITFTGDAIAWWGAITGSVGLGLSFLQVWRDRAAIKITVGPDYVFTQPTTGYDPTYPYVLVTVVNRGRRPVPIMKSWWTFRSSPNKGLIADSMSKGPTEYGEGKHASYLTRQDQLNLADLKSVVVEDSTGKEWRKKVDFRKHVPDGARKMLIPNYSR